MNYEIIPGRLEHLRALAHAMREQDREEAETMACGVPLRHFLTNLYRGSVDCRVALVDGEVAVVWGVLGPLLATEAQVWLFTSGAVERARFSFFREVRIAVAAMLETHHSVVTVVTASYLQAIRFYEMAGFVAGPAYEYGGRLVRDLRLTRKEPALPTKYDFAVEQPIQTVISMTDDVFIKQIVIPKAETYAPQHSHVYDHTSMLAVGKIRLWADGRLVGDFTAPKPIKIVAGVKHMFQSLTDGVVFYCIHSIARTGEVEVLEEHELAA